MIIDPAQQFNQFGPGSIVSAIIDNQNVNMVSMSFTDNRTEMNKFGKWLFSVIINFGIIERKKD